MGPEGVATDTFVLTVTPPATLVGIQNVPPPPNTRINAGSSVPMVWRYNVGSTVVDSSTLHHQVIVTGRRIPCSPTRIRAAAPSATTRSRGAGPSTCRRRPRPE